MTKILITCLYPNESNPVFAYSIAEALIKKGFNVYALLEKSTLNIENWVELVGEDRVETIDIEYYTKKTSSFEKYNRMIQIAFMQKDNLFPKFKGMEFDYALYTFYHHWNDLLLYKIRAKKRILFLHDPIPHTGESKKRLGAQKKQAKAMDELIVLSKSFVDTVAREYKISIEKIHYMPHGSMNYKKNTEDKFVQFKNNEKIRFLFFGRITPYKGIDTLLNAFKIVKQKTDECDLTIAGNGDCSDILDIIENDNRINLINRYIDDAEIGELFSETNTVVILPYKDATQSGVIPIAASYGNPVIVSNTGGLKEQLADGKIGIFVDPNNEKKLAEAMMKVVLNRELIEEQSKLIKEYEKSLSWDKIVDDLTSEVGMK